MSVFLRSKLWFLERLFQILSVFYVSFPFLPPSPLDLIFPEVWPLCCAHWLQPGLLSHLFSSVLLKNHPRVSASYYRSPPPTAPHIITAAQGSSVVCTQVFRLPSHFKVSCVHHTRTCHVPRRQRRTKTACSCSHTASGLVAETLENPLHTNVKLTAVIRSLTRGAQGSERQERLPGEGED